MFRTGSIDLLYCDDRVMYSVLHCAALKLHSAPRTCLLFRTDLSWPSSVRLNQSWSVGLLQAYTLFFCSVVALWGIFVTHCVYPKFLVGKIFAVVMFLCVAYASIYVIGASVLCCDAVLEMLWCALLILLAVPSAPATVLRATCEC